VFGITLSAAIFSVGAIGHELLTTVLTNNFVGGPSFASFEFCIPIPPILPAAVRAKNLFPKARGMFKLFPASLAEHMLSIFLYSSLIPRSPGKAEAADLSARKVQLFSDLCIRHSISPKTTDLSHLFLCERRAFLFLFG
jgi:hypothetical protein